MGESGRLEMIVHARNTPALLFTMAEPGGTEGGGD